jgi:hypothetical protein
MANTPPGEPQESAVALYEKRRQSYDRQRQQLDRRASTIAAARLATFIVAAAGLIWGWWGLELSSPLAALAGASAVLAFVALVLWHDRVLRARDWAATMQAINDESLHRLARHWDQLPRYPWPESLRSNPLVRDLDLLPTGSGRAALSQLLGPVNSPQGQQTLLEWLVQNEGPAPDLAGRQQAVAELARLLDFRQDFDGRGRQLRRTKQDPEQFLQWAEGAPWLAHRTVLVWVLRLWTTLSVALTAGYFAGLVPTGWLIVALVLNLSLEFLWGRKAIATFDSIAGRRQALRHYAQLFDALEQVKFDAPTLQAVHQRLQPQGLSVARTMKRLDRLNGLADARLTPLFHLPLAAVTLWDFHVLLGFESWQHRFGRQARQWFAALGELETLCALATLAYDHPDWTFPNVDESRQALEAQGLAHPLLRPTAAVVNDVVVGPHGNFLLVTGSNMSGKSTLLRALGTNVILAQAGAPVCARNFSLPPLVLGTSFRVDDSLEAGVSFFMAELRRLKSIVELAATTKQAGRHRLLFLLDEILQGTNVYERQIAVRRVIVHLLNHHALGAVSTHDLTLAETPDLEAVCVPCHFTETYSKTDEGPQMRFDYHLHQGIASTTNALKLLGIVGLGED